MFVVQVGHEFVPPCLDSALYLYLGQPTDIVIKPPPSARVF
jgi:hypothetical protein